MKSSVDRKFHRLPKPENWKKKNEMENNGTLLSIYDALSQLDKIANQRNFTIHMIVTGLYFDGIYGMQLHAFRLHLPGAMPNQRIASRLLWIVHTQLHLFVTFSDKSNEKPAITIAAETVRTLLAGTWHGRRSQIEKSPFSTLSSRIAYKSPMSKTNFLTVHLIRSKQNETKRTKKQAIFRL